MRAIILAGVLLVAGRVFGAAPFVFLGGAVQIEAEEFGTNLVRNGQGWSTAAAVSGFSGAGYVEALPNPGVTVDADWATNSPELQYEVEFPASGSYRLWVSGYATGGADDSVHVGLDGVTGGASRVTWSIYNAWTWTNGVIGGGVATMSVPSAGTHVVNLWMREDGARIDRLLITTNPALVPRVGNAWHIPQSTEPTVGFMRAPIFEIYAGRPVLLNSGSQYQGGGEAGNQLQTGSAVYYRDAATNVWSALPLAFHATSGNNIYYSNALPAAVLGAGCTIQYYLRIPYSDHLTTWLYTSNGVALESDNENVARANPYAFTVLPSPPAGEPSPEDWADRNIYFIFTDRFNDGDPSNNNGNLQSAAAPSNSRRIHGGDFKGIQQKLDYIRALGANAIWITPIPQNVGASGYHGYGADDFTQLQPNWGTLAELSNMVAAAHARGIAVTLDVVCNHAGNRIDSTDSGWPAYKDAGYNLRWTTGTPFPAPFNATAYFHNKGNIGSFSDPQQVLGELNGLDDLRTEDLYVRTNLVNIYKQWIQAGDFDGFRLDTVKHTDLGVWQHFGGEMRAFASAAGKTNFFQFGEVYDGSDAKCGAYTGTQGGNAYAIDSVVDFPLHFQINGVFATAVSNTKVIEDRYNGINANYAESARMRLVTFLDNHDRPRFMTTANANNNIARLTVALTFLYTSRGIPCLYYGTEQNFNGSGDPNNREDMYDGQFEQGPSLGDNFNMTQGSFRHVAMLNNFRRNYSELRRGTHVNLWNDPDSPGLFAYARRLGTNEVFVVFNTASGSQTLGARPTVCPAGTLLVNLLNTNESVTVTGAADGIPSITVPATSAKMFVAAGRMLPLDPVVTNQTPAHGAVNVSPVAAVKLGFSKPMNTNAVQQAFTVQPVVGGVFTWSANGTQMTFTPNLPGFAGATSVVVRVGANAFDRVSTNHLFAAFETFFVTSASTNTDTTPPTVAIDTVAGGGVVRGAVTLSGTAADNVSVQRVEMRLDAGEWTAVDGTVAWSRGFDSALFLNGAHTLSARAIDAIGNLSAEVVTNVYFFNVAGAYDVRISAGNGSDATNCDGSVWMADRAYSFGGFGYVGGTNGFIAGAISNVCAGAQVLYQRERYSTPASSFRYQFQCPPGVYETVLLETETFATGTGQREFDLYLQNERALTNFDIYAVAGGKNQPLVLVFTNAVADALLDMQFLPQVGNARVSGIQVRKVADLDSDGDGIPDWWQQGWFNHPTGQAADESGAEDDPDGDGVNNRDEYVAGTDPFDDASYLRIEAIESEAGRAVLLNSVSGRVYDLETRVDLLGAEAWTAILESVVGDGGVINFPDTNGVERGFYRVRVYEP